MGWLDKLLGREKKETEGESTYQPPAAPAADRPEPSYGSTPQAPAEEKPPQEDQP